jgi:hypothetical protein
MISDPTSPMLSSRHYLIGTRGLGKSTILNYIAYRLFSEISEKKVIPIYVSLLGRATNEKELEKYFFRSCLEGLLDLSTVFPLYGVEKLLKQTISRIDDAIIEYKTQIKNFGEISLEYVYTAFENQLRHLSEEFVKTIFLIDGLDKQDMEFVLGFFRNTQERFNTLIAKFNCAFIDAADPSWRDSLEMKEFSGVRGMSFHLRGWTLDEVELLIKRRLECVYVFKMPFKKETLQVLVEDFQGNPREILQHATVLLHYAAKQRMPSIEPGIARSIVWKEDAKNKLHDSIVREPELQIAYEKLKGIFDNLQLMNILIAAYITEPQKLWVGLDYERRSSLGVTVNDSEFPLFLQILKNKGCLRDSKTPNHVELERDILQLFDVVNKLKQPLVTLPVVLSDLSSKIIVVGTMVEKEVSLKKEIETVFQQNSRRWLTYEDTKSRLLENPRRQGMFEVYFGKDYEKKISSTLPLITSQLFQQGQLIKDEERNLFRWRPSVIDAETAQSLPYEDVLDELETAKEMASSDNVTGVHFHCNAIFNICISRLDFVFQNKLSGKSLNEMQDFFKTMGMDIERPIPLNLFLEMLNRPPSTKEEADMSINGTIIYSKRILDRYDIFKKHEETAMRKLSSIQQCTTGSSKEKERTYFNKYMFPTLMSRYGMMVEFMKKAKLGKGYVESIPEGPDFENLLENGVFLKSRLFGCPKCGQQSPIAITGDIKAVNCPTDKSPMTYIKDVFMLSNDAYQSWNVWIEEYTGFILEHLPCRFTTTGACLKPADVKGVSLSCEIDGIAIYKGLSIAVECKENLCFLQGRNDIADAIAKVQALGLFDVLLLVYKSADDGSLFDSAISSNRRLVFPVVVQSPDKFKEALQSALKNIEKTADLE